MKKSEGAASSARARAPWQLKLNQQAAWLGLVSKIEQRKLLLSALPGIFRRIQEEGLNVLAGVNNDAAIQRQFCRFQEVGWTGD